MFLFALLAMEWLLEHQIATCDIQTLLAQFTQQEVNETQRLLQQWLAIRAVDPSASPKVHRRHLCDNSWQVLRGMLYPRRVIGALIDRMGYY